MQELSNENASKALISSSGRKEKVTQTIKRQNGCNLLNTRIQKETQTQQRFANLRDHEEAVLLLVVEGSIGKEVAGLIRKGRK